MPYAYCFGDFYRGGVNNNQYRPNKDNKSLKRNVDYSTEEYLDDGQKYFHLSFDDVINIFQDITLHEEYESIFENNILKWFKELHDQYDVVISCYVFYENDSFGLAQCTDRYRQEFEEHADWLRFGFHALNGETVYGKDEPDRIREDYLIAITKLCEIVGSNSIDNVIRLQSFQGSKREVEALTLLKEEAVTGLLTSDDLRQSYYLTKEENEYIYCHDEWTDLSSGMKFLSTDLRIEFITNIRSKLNELTTKKWNNQTRYLIVFSHEWEISIELKEKTEKLCSWALEKGYEFVFPEDVI